MKNNFNVALTIFICLVIVRHITSLISTIPLIIAWSSSDYMSILALGWNVVLNLSMIIILFYLLQAKRWSIYLFGGLQIINVIFQYIFLEKDFLNSLIVAVLLCITMATLLCLKKDGISAWKLLIGKGNVVSDDEQSISTDVSESIIEYTTDNFLMQNSDVKDSISTENIKEYLDDNIIQEVTESKISKLTAKGDEVEDTLLTDLPYKEDGSIDYENMTSAQQFVYTSKTESIKVALMDLNADIKVLEEAIRELKKNITSLQGSNRAMQRDYLRKKQSKLEELYNLRGKYSSNKGWKMVVGATVILATISICILVGTNKNILYKTGVRLDWSNDNSQNAENVMYFEDDLTKLYNGLLNAGYTLVDIGNEKVFREKMQDVKNRRVLYDYVAKRGDFAIGEYGEYEKRVLAALNRKWLYDKLIEIYDLDDYKTFYQKLDDENNRKRIYDAALEEGLQVGTWKEFNELVGGIVYDPN